MKRYLCTICLSNDWANLYQDVLKCRSCGFIRASDQFFNINPRHIYNQAYYKGIEYFDYEKERSPLEKNFRDRMMRILKYKKTGELLEIGSAFGFFLNLAKRRFNCTGIDLDKDTTENARLTSSVRVMTGDLLNLKFDKQFDIICMFDTIEHLQKPREYLKKINALLKPKGILVIETGDINALLPRIQKRHWRLIVPRVHLSYFSKESLTRLLNLTGFEIVQVDYVGFNRSILQIVHSLFKNKLIDKLANYIPFWSISVNTFDLMFVIAKKNETNIS